MKIIIACEFSGVVREAFRKRGHDAWSCDLLPTEIPGQHYQGNIFDIINDGWDMMVAHPPCTYLTCTANKWLKDQPPRKSGALVGAERREARREAINFFLRLYNSDIEKICIENPVGCMSTELRKPDQIIKPEWFGHKEQKLTCLWIKNMPILNKTNVVNPEKRMILKSGKSMPGWYSMKPENRSKKRSITFQGIANAMAEQWG